MASGNKTPASIKSFESELKKAQKELEELEKRKIEIDVSINQEQLNYSKYVKNGDASNADKSAKRINSFDADAIETEKRIDILKSKINELSNKIEDIKFNPKNAEEVKQLQQQLGLAESKLESSKKKANELKNEYNSLSGKTFLNELDKANSKVRKLGTTLLSSFSKKNPFKSINNQLNSLNKKVGQLGKRITGLITGALIFNVLSSGLSKLSNGLIGALNSNSQFASSLNQIKVNLLTAFAPIYNYVLPAINALMSALSSITGQIATFVSGLFGQTAAQAKSGAKSIYDQSKAYQDLGKNAKKAKNSLSSIDEIENLNDNENDASSSSDGGNAPSLDFSGEVEQSGKLLDYLNEIKALISQGDFFGVGQKLASSINNAISSFDVVSLTNKISTGMLNAVQVFNGFINELDWSMLGTKLGQLVIGLTKGLANAIKNVDWEALGTGLREFILGIDWIGIINAVIDLISAGAIGIDKFLTGLFGENGATIIESIALAIGAVTAALAIYNGVTAVAAAVTGLLTSPITLVILAMGALIAIIILVIKHFDTVKEVAKNVVGSIVGFVQGFVNTISSLVGGLISLFNAWFTFLGEIISAPFVNLFETVKEIFQNIINFGKNMVDGIKKLFSGDLTGALNSFKAAFGNIFNSLWAIVKAPLNLIIGGINSLLKGINKIKLDVPSWVPGLGGKSLGFNIPQIPRLAKGAVIPPNAQFAAILGDQKHGRNLEAPEDLIRQIVREEGASSEMISLLIDLNRNILTLSNMCAILNIDSTEMAKALFKPLENERNRQQQSTTVVRS